MDVGGQGFRGSKNVFLHVINWWPNKAEKVSEFCFVLLIFLICVTDYFSDAEEYDDDQSLESSEEESTNLLKCHGQSNQQIKCSKDEPILLL